MKKNDLRIGVNQSGEKDQANEFAQSAGEVSHFKTSIAGSSIA